MVQINKTAEFPLKTKVAALWIIILCVAVIVLAIRITAQSRNMGAEFERLAAFIICTLWQLLSFLGIFAAISLLKKKEWAWSLSVLVLLLFTPIFWSVGSSQSQSFICDDKCTQLVTKESQDAILRNYYDPSSSYSFDEAHRRYRFGETNRGLYITDRNCVSKCKSFFGFLSLIPLLVPALLLLLDRKNFWSTMQSLRVSFRDSAYLAPKRNLLIRFFSGLKYFFYSPSTFFEKVNDENVIIALLVYSVTLLVGFLKGLMTSDNLFFFSFPIFIYAAGLFLLTKLFGSSGSYGQSIKVVAYGLVPLNIGALLLFWIDNLLVVSFVFGIYSLVLTFFGIKKLHNLSSWKSLAVLVILIVVVAAVFLGPLQFFEIVNF